MHIEKYILGNSDHAIRINPKSLGKLEENRGK